MARGTEFPAQAQTLGYLLRAPYARLSKLLYRQLAGEGYDDIRPSHRAVFRYLAPGGCRLTELAEQADMTKQSMAYLVESLRQAGYLEIHPDPADGRAKRVYPSEKGHRLLERLVASSADLERQVADQLGEDFTGDLRSMLGKLDRAVEGIATDRSGDAGAPS